MGKICCCWFCRGPAANPQHPSRPEPRRTRPPALCRAEHEYLNEPTWRRNYTLPVRHELDFNLMCLAHQLTPFARLAGIRQNYVRLHSERTHGHVRRQRLPGLALFKFAPGCHLRVWRHSLWPSRPKRHGLNQSCRGLPEDMADRSVGTKADCKSVQSDGLPAMRTWNLS